MPRKTPPPAGARVVGGLFGIPETADPTNLSATMADSRNGVRAVPVAATMGSWPAPTCCTSRRPRPDLSHSQGGGYAALRPNSRGDALYVVEDRLGDPRLLSGDEMRRASTNRTAPAWRSGPGEDRSRSPRSISCPLCCISPRRMLPALSAACSMSRNGMSSTGWVAMRPGRTSRFPMMPW